MVEESRKPCLIRVWQTCKWNSQKQQTKPSKYRPKVAEEISARDKKHFPYTNKAIEEQQKLHHEQLKVENASVISEEI